MMLLFTLTIISILKLSTPFTLANLQPDQLLTVAGKSNSDNFGRAVKNAGDVNGDGFDDIIIGALNANGGTGAAYVIYGRKDFSNIDLFTETLNPASTGFHILENAAGDKFGGSVSGAGDINNDGYDDIIIGAYGKLSGRGIVYVVYGNPNNKLSNIDLKTQTLDPATTGFTITGDATGDNLGYSVGSAKNFNGDDYDDIIIGATGKGGGAAYVIYGKPTASFTNLVLATSTLLPMTTGFLITGGGSSGMFGFPVSFAGDLNGDGLSDVIIGATLYNSRGAAYVIYGKQGSSFATLNLGTVTLDPASTGFQILGQSSYFGGGARAAGDVNGDGIDDIIVGAYGSLSAVYVIYGKLTANIDLATQTLDPQSTGFVVKGSLLANSLANSLGYSCDAADIDKDGFSDIIFSSRFANNNQGSLFVVYGKPKGELANIDLGVNVLDPKEDGFAVSGIAAQDYFGHSISAAGDFDGDGKPDIAGGAYGRLGKGAAYVIFPSKICVDNCDECRHPSRCKICSHGFKLLDDYTCEECPGGTYPVENACKDCPKGCIQCTSESTCQVCDDGYTLLDSGTCIEKKHNVPQAANAAAGLEGTSSFGSFLSPGSSLPLYFTLSAKLIRNTRYLAIHVSNKLEIERFGWTASSSFLSAPSSWSDKSELNMLPKAFSQYDLEPAFLINYWKPLIMSLIGLGLFTVFKLIEILIPKEKKFWNSAARSLSIMTSNFTLTQLYTNLDDVFFFFVLDARSGGFDTPLRTISYALAILLVIIVILALGFHIAFLHKYQYAKHQKGPLEFDGFVEKSENISLLIRDLKDESLIQQIFLFLHVTRGILANVVTTTLFEYPMFQTCLLTLFSLCIVVYLLIKRPFKHLNVLCGQYFSEAILLIVNLSMLILAAFDQNSSGSVDAVSGLSNIIFILNYVLFYGAMGFMALEMCKSLYDVYKNQKKASKNSLEAQGKTIFRPRELDFENNKKGETYQKNENLAVSGDLQKSPPQSRNEHNTTNLNDIPNIEDSLSTNASPQIRPILDASTRLRSQTMPYHLRDNSYLESKTFDNSLDTSNAELILNSPIRGHSKTIQVRKMTTGIFQPRRNLDQYISTNVDSSILQTTEGNIKNNEVMKIRGQQEAFGNSSICPRQVRAQGYKEFLRQNMKVKFANKK